MAKLNPIFGKATGKVGGSVFQINSGVQIWKEKATKVTNPNTDAQVAQRAKLKLMSQLAAALAPGLGFKKIGLVSARNQFVSKNIGFATYENGKASVLIQSLQLTPGTIAAPVIDASRPSGASNFSVDLSDGQNSVFEKIVLVSAKRVDESNLQVLEVKIVDKNSSGSFDTATISGTDSAAVVFAYGVVAGTSKQKGIYGDAAVDTAETGVELSANIMSYIRNATLSLTTNGLIEENPE